MKLTAAVTAILFIFSINAQSPSLTRIEHTLRNGTAGEIAAMLSLECPKKSQVSRVKELVYLLKKPHSSTRIKNEVSSHDVILLMISHITKIPLTDKDVSKVKAIISYQNSKGKIFRYHLIKLNDKELKEFSKKVERWIIDKSHA